MEVHKKIDTIADTSFYSCFLNDINDIPALIKIIASNKFYFVLGPILKSELTKNKNYPKIKPYLDRVKKEFDYNVGELVMPFLGKMEIKKGEHEAIGIAIVYTSMGLEYILILDEDGPRKLVEKLSKDIPTLSKMSCKMTGTIGFIKKCTCEYGIFNNNESLNILKKIKTSKFRVKGDLVDKIIKEIEEAMYS